MNEFTLSIITVNLNNVSGLRRTIESVVNQSFSNIEYIIIDGGSTDGSVKYIRENEEKLRYWISESDKGIYDAMNKGIRQALGAYLQFLNSGDTLFSSTIIEQVFGVKRTADIVYGDINYILENGEKKVYRSLRENQLTMANFFKNTIAHPAAFIKRSLFENGLYDDSLQIVADNKFFYEHVIFRNCSVQCLNMVIVDFDTTGLSSNPENWPKTNMERERVIAELLPPRILKDYEIIKQIINSPLLRYLPVLNKTSGFHRLVGGVVGVMVKIYTFFRRVNLS